ncbi:hypothetical protein [Streptomyces sp. NBC_01465]|uniref:hypothetical protein n=1 Tax=Streptomyces sp. NBC_01465 TaxID=2903878 RepID=UPI002E305B0A|nr:hypothetical protein [Streptomyces sp. NBC_01465]
MLTASDCAQVHGCRIEGPADSTSTSAVDVVDFDLVDGVGDCVLAAQVKSASPGRQVSAPDAFTILAELVSKVEAETYELITAALPDRNCRALAKALDEASSSPLRLKEVLAGLLERAPSATARLEALSEQDLARLGRARMVFDSRDTEAIRQDLRERLRQRRARHRAGLGGRSAGLIIGHLVAEIMRRAAEPREAYWTIADFTAAALVDDDVLVRAMGRQDWGTVFGSLPPVPDVARPLLLGDIAEVLTPPAPDARLVNSCVLAGLSGIGKSSAAAAYVAEHADRYDLVFWIEAATEEALTASFRRVWGHLNGHAQDGSTSSSTAYLREQVHELLSALPGRWLLIFDDASPTTADPWIPRLGRGDVLITSIDSAGWHHAPSIGVSRMNHAQAVELLTCRLLLSNEAATAHQESLDALADTLEGWPLAIELACGYMRTCSIPVERLDHYRSLLLDRALNDRRSVPSGYPRTLAATIDLSLERLAQNTADDSEFPYQVQEVLGFLCYFASQRIPVHLAMASAFIGPDAVPAGAEAIFLDESTVPVREIIRSLIQVSFVRYAEPLPVLYPQFPGSDDTVSMNTVLQHLLRQRLAQGAGVQEALSRSAFHTARWLGAALDSDDGDRAWEVAQHAAVLVDHIQVKAVKDNHTAILIGNLAGFEHVQGQTGGALRLLHLELAWLEELADPNELLIAQTRISLAQLYTREESSEAPDQALTLLPPLIDYLDRVRREDAGEPAAALLATKVRLLLHNLADQHPDDLRLRSLLNAFTTVTTQLPQTPAVAELIEGDRIARLFGDGDVQGVAHAARDLLHGSGHSFHAAEVQRQLIEALAYQHRWQEAEAEFEKYLVYTGPRSLYRSSVQDFVHNVGLACALAWLHFVSSQAAALLHRVLTESGTEHLEAALPDHERARFTLLKAVDAAARSDTAVFLPLMRELGANPFDREGLDPSSPWEQVLQSLVDRLKITVSTQIHDQIQANGEWLFDLSRMPALQRAEIRRIIDEARILVHCALSGESPFQSLSINRNPMSGDSMADAPTPIMLMEPRHTLTAAAPQGGTMEFQVHRISGAGFRRMNPEVISIPTAPGWRLRRRGGRLELRDQDGTVWARALTSLPPRWHQAAIARGRVLVVYGFGLGLEEPAEERAAFASPRAFAEHFHVAASAGLLTAAYVAWDPTPPRQAARRQKGRKQHKR